jgi:hypothetical protein
MTLALLIRATDGRLESDPDGANQPVSPLRPQVAKQGSGPSSSSVSEMSVELLGPAASQKDG